MMTMMSTRMGIMMTVLLMSMMTTMTPMMTKKMTTYSLRSYNATRDCQGKSYRGPYLLLVPPCDTIFIIILTLNMTLIVFDM